MCHHVLLLVQGTSRVWSPAPALGDTVLLHNDAQPDWQDDLTAADLAQLDAIEAAYKVRLYQVSHRTVMLRRLQVVASPLTAIQACAHNTREHN